MEQNYKKEIEISQQRRRNATTQRRPNFDHSNGSSSPPRPPPSPSPVSPLPPPPPTTTMGDEETNLIDQLAAGMGDDTLDTNNESKSNSTLATGEGKKSDQDQMEEAAKRRADKKKLKTDWKKLTPEQLFEKYDADGSGGINFDEFKIMLKEMGQNLSEAKAFKYFRQCDTDGGGEIDMAEFKVALFIIDPDGGNNVGFKPNTLLGPRDAFDLFDEDRSGSLDEDEFSLALEYMKMPVSDGKLEMLFAKYDADGSGSVEYKEFRTAWLQLADPKKELSAREIEFNKYAPPFQLRKQLKEVIMDEEEEEAHAQAVAETWKQFQIDKIQKDEDSHLALKRANDELCNALDAAGQVYIFGSGSHEQFVGDAVPPSRIFQHFEHLRKLWKGRVAPDGGGNHLKFRASVADSLAGTVHKKDEEENDNLMVRDHTGKLVLAGSKKDQTSPFDGLVCAELGASLWARGVTKIGVGENTAFALTKAGEIIGFGGRDHLWEDILPGSRWAREDRGVMTERSQLLLGVKGRMSWFDLELRKKEKRKKKIKLENLANGIIDEDGDPDDPDVWFQKMKVCAEYFGVYEPPPPDSRNDFMKNVVLKKLDHKHVKLSLEVRLKRTKDKNKQQLLLELYDDLRYEEKSIGARTQKKIRALEVQIIDFTVSHKTKRSDRLKKQIADDFWTELLAAQGKEKSNSAKRKKAIVEAEFVRNEQRYEVWLERVGEAMENMDEYSPRTGKSKIQVGGATERGPGPKIVSGGGQVVDIGVGAQHVCAVSRYLSLYSWGDNNFGRLGHKSTKEQRVVQEAPTQVEVLKGQKTVSVSCGYSHSACIMQDGSLRVWGGGSAGKLGIGDIADEFECFCEHPIPLPMPGGRRVRQVACGRLHTAAVTMSGDLFMWGAGDGGRLGMGENDLKNKTTPTLVEYLSSMDVRVWRVACGASHTVICTAVQEVVQGHGVMQITVTKGGEVMQCGATRALGRFTPRFSIVRKLKGLAVKAIGAGDSHSAAVTTDGELYTWGVNTNGCAAHPVVKTFLPEPTVVECLHVQSESLAKGKPVSQSSVYNRRGPETAINGEINGAGEAMCIHTQRDQCPWWQVDLGRLAVINTIEVWNREDVPLDLSQGEDYFTKRLFPCWLLLSTDPFPEGTSGQVLNDSANMAVARVKMKKDKRRTVWELPTNSVGRYVRIMLEGTNYLHFAQCNVYGTWGVHRSVGRVSDVYCGFQSTIAILLPTMRRSDAELAYSRAVGADPFAAAVLRQYLEYVPYYQKYGEKDPSPGKCLNCRGGVRCELCIFNARWPMKKLQDKSKWNPKGPGGRLRRLQSKVNLLLNDRMPKTKFKRRKKNKKNLAGKAAAAMLGKMTGFFTKKKAALLETKEERPETDEEDVSGEKKKKKKKDKKKKDKEKKKKKKKRKKEKREKGDPGGVGGKVDEGKRGEGKVDEGKMEESKRNKK